MRRRAFFTMVGLWVFAWAVAGTPAGATSVQSEREVSVLLELEDTESVMQALAQARQQVVQRQSRRGRDVTVKGIRDFFDLSDKYAAVAYKATISPDTPAIAMVLFERGASSLIIPRNFPYLFFVGPTDIATYERIDDAGICGYFREMGITDCVPVFTQRRWKQMLSEKADRNHTHDLANLSGVLPAERIDSSLVRRSELTAALENKADISLVQPLLVGGVVAAGGEGVHLHQRIATLEAQVAHLTRLLEGVQRTGSNLQLEGINLILVNGEGKTASTNGTGNLVIGYSKLQNVTGSHNMLVGDNHSCSGYGSLISGSGHKVTGVYGAAVSGKDNTVSGQAALAIGGEENRADGDFSATVGGRKNRAGGKNAIISGGQNRSVMDENPHFTE
ncbi:hypothetical protein OOT00_14215 [Desulfobotulus sp. H1]|uniref:Uncharacterized protein n=1 Tax=Desulfobotulus pelophilus TaxID=2823377 RepID=A0ABT3NCE9_9BACT|nr:hypothetical protein [Desulfobotulus pelophilus]MCW7755139.1 hypothetical protein [Desulfobotulus pelophilus]